MTADEGFSLAGIGHAYLRFAEGDMAAARAGAAEALKLGVGATRRERDHVAALAAIINGDTARSTVLVKNHVGEFPLDVLMVFVAQFRLSFSGGRSWKQEIAALTEAVAPAYDPDEWSILGMRAFRAEEERDLDVARFLAERSLDLYPENARAAHVLAHTYFERGEHQAGTRFLEQWLTNHHPQRLFEGHLWWHIALHKLGLGDGEGACHTLRTGIAQAGRNRFRVPDVASLLWRMDLYQLGTTSEDWQEASDLAAQTITSPGFAFLDAHAALAHAGAHRTDRLNAFIGQLEAQAAGGNGPARDVVLPLARGVRAFADRNFSRAVRELEPLMSGELVRLGGSNAQREVFEDTFIAALVGAGHARAAREMIGPRLARRPSWIDDRWQQLLAKT